MSSVGTSRTRWKVSTRTLRRAAATVLRILQGAASAAAVAVCWSVLLLSPSASVVVGLGVGYLAGAAIRAGIVRLG